MRVLQMNAFCGYGCTGRIAVDLYSILEEQGNTCAIGYSRSIADTTVRNIKIGNKFDNNMHGLYTRLTDKNGFASKTVTKKFIKEVEKFNPDIIHLHIMHGYYVNLELLFEYFKKANKPVIWTFHDCWAFTGHCVYFDYIKCEKWKVGCSNCPQRKKHPTSWLIDNSKWNYRKKKELFTSLDKMVIVTPSQWLADFTKQSFWGNSL